MEQPPFLPARPSTLLAIAAGAALGAWAASRTAEVLGIGAPPATSSAREGARGARVATPAPGPRAADPSERGATVAPAPLPDGAHVAVAVAAAPLPTPAPPASRGPPGADAPGTDAEGAEAARLTDGMRRLVRDLEYNANAGLPEPPQQLVAPAPEPWRPDPAAAGAPPPMIDAIEPLGAPAGSGARVVLRGKNLWPAQVMFGVEPARIVTATGDAVTVIAPSGRAGAVVIAVTNLDGAFALSRQPFTFGPPRQ